MPDRGARVGMINRLTKSTIGINILTMKNNPDRLSKTEITLAIIIGGVLGIVLAIITLVKYLPWYFAGIAN